VEGLLCKIDVAPLDVEGVVWIDFAHGSSSAPCAQDTMPKINTQQQPADNALQCCCCVNFDHHDDNTRR
jgi:hypothetical protein